MGDEFSEFKYPIGTVLAHKAMRENVCLVVGRAIVETSLGRIREYIVSCGDDLSNRRAVPEDEFEGPIERVFTTKK